MCVQWYSLSVLMQKVAHIVLYLAFFTQHFDLEMTSHQYTKAPFILITAT